MSAVRLPASSWEPPEWARKIALHVVEGSIDLERALADTQAEPEEGWPEGDLHPSQVLLAIGETIGQPCSICRSRHGSEVRHAAE